MTTLKGVSTGNSSCYLPVSVDCRHSKLTTSRSSHSLSKSPNHPCLPPPNKRIDHPSFAFYWPPWQAMNMIPAGVLLAINQAQQTQISNLSIHGLAAHNDLSRTVPDSTAASLYTTVTNLRLHLTLDLFLNSLLRRTFCFSYKQQLLQQNPNSTRCGFSPLICFFAFDFLM
jgi:hypothetical protein